MARQFPLATQLIADLFVAIEQDDPLATLQATQALAERVGSQAATAIAIALLADRRDPHGVHSFAPFEGYAVPLVACA
jgi:hypothetical protein